jgi:hypothetical protein
MSVLHIIAPTFDFNTINPDSKLLTSGVDQLNGNYHTSVGDMSTAEILIISDRFDCISFVPDSFDLDSDTYKESIILLNILSHKKSVTGHTLLPITQFLSHDVSSRPDEPVLWVFGCSHSHGIGLRSNEKTFGQILAADLGVPLLQISKPGSSFSWSFRHLINADIRASDYVVWQITTPHRLSLFDGKDTKEVGLSQTTNRCLLDVNDDNQVFFNHINLLTTGVRYLRKVNKNFVLTDITPKCSNYYGYKLEYSKYPEYLYHPNLYIDHGTDGVHVGPLSHLALAKCLLDRL